MHPVHKREKIIQEFLEKRDFITTEPEEGETRPHPAQEAHILYRVCIVVVIVGILSALFNA